MTTPIQDFYHRVKKDPNCIVKDVGEPDPIIISETDYICKLVDGSTAMRTIYVTFEYVKKHLKELKGCDCEACQSAVAAYRVNKKVIKAFRAGATDKEAEAFIPDGWIREMPH